MQALSAHATSGAADLPRVVCGACRSTRRQLRAALIELGAFFSDDPIRTEISFERAFAFL